MKSKNEKQKKPSDSFELRAQMSGKELAKYTQEWMNREQEISKEPKKFLA